jgi:hypothetical protein
MKGQLRWGKIVMDFLLLNIYSTFIQSFIIIEGNMGILFSNSEQNNN